MAFKSDYSFLEKISMGAVGTRKVAEYLNSQGHRIIELERCSMSNKIWATKVKRLRVPDLLCLQCGRRIESRAKSSLEIKMSDSPTKPDRRWDYGLRDDDLVAFIHCTKDDDHSLWVASSVVNLFSIRNLRATVEKSKLGPPKSASEGAERDRTWPSWVPGKNGKIVSVDSKRIQVLYEGDCKYSYPLKGKFCHVQKGDTFTAGSLIAASVIPNKEDGRCREDGYDFLNDLKSNERENVYCAVKALGFFPDIKKSSVPVLSQISTDHPDKLVRLESAGALARLDESKGWELLDSVVNDDSKTQEERMEGVLILGEELPHSKCLDILQSVADNKGNPSELRAAAVWSMGHHGSVALKQLLSFIDDCDLDVALHAIVSTSRVVEDGDIGANVRKVLDVIGGNRRKSAAAVKILLMHKSEEAISEIVSTLLEAKGEKRGWLLYLVGLLGPTMIRDLLEPHGDNGKKVIREVDVLWNFHHANWINEFDVENGLAFISKQW